MDKSWIGIDRVKQRYKNDVASFLDFAVDNLQLSNEKSWSNIFIPCPCTKCINHAEESVDEVALHLFTNGIDQTYTTWFKHGEKEDPPRNVFGGENYVTHGEEYNYVDSTNPTTGIPTDAAETVEMVEATKENFTNDHEKFQKLIEDAKKPLYEGFPDFTKLSAIVHLLNLKSKYRVSDKCFNDMIALFKKMLPKGKEMVSRTDEAKKAIKAMGSGYTKIQACINDYILYGNEYADHNVCPTCGKSRWKVDEAKNKIF